MIERMREELEKKRYLDTVIHALVAIFLCFAFSSFFQNLKKETIVLTVFLGSFLPDFDHFLLYRKHRFYSFKAFLKWIIYSSRYRISFELFHNLPCILVTLFLLPFLYLRNKLMFVFFVAFLFHLVADLVIDRIVLRNVRFWRFGF